MTQQELKEAVKTAMRNREAVKLSVLRGLVSACTNKLVEKRMPPDGTLSDEDVMSLILTATKQRKDSIVQFEKGGRPELAESEREELSILMEMLPVQLSEKEIQERAHNKANELGITSSSDANKLMGLLMKDLRGEADGTLVKKVVDEMFS